MTSQKEDFLKSLLPNVSKKLKQLKLTDNLVLTEQKGGSVTELETNKPVIKKDWAYTMKSLAEQFHVSLPWLYNHLRNEVRYVYINKFNLQSQAFFYEKPIADLYNFHHLDSVHLNTNDVYKWFNGLFSYGIRSKIIPASLIFGDNTDTIVFNFALGYLQGSQHIYDDAEKFVQNQQLWNLCVKAPNFRKTSKYPLIELPSPIDDPYNLRYTKFDTLSNYKYSSTGMNVILRHSAGIFKAKTGRNGKMLFIYNSDDAFDVAKLSDRLYKFLKDAHYKPSQIEQAIVTTENLFAVPAIQYFEMFPDELPK